MTAWHPKAFNSCGAERLGETGSHRTNKMNNLKVLHVSRSNHKVVETFIMGKFEYQAIYDLDKSVCRLYRGRDTKPIPAMTRSDIARYPKRAYQYTQARLSELLAERTQRPTR